MRGYDYRAFMRGICLVIAKSFVTRHDADQGLARVGRYGDKCQRILVNGVSLVDKGKELMLMQPLRRFKMAHISKPSIVKVNQTKSNLSKSRDVKFFNKMN